MSGSKHIFLSYLLDKNLSGYGNGQRIEIENLRSISSGDTSNNTYLRLPSHFGTHIDFPHHFSNDGLVLNDYSAECFVFDNIKLIEINCENNSNYLITIDQLGDVEYNEEIDFLIVKTGFCYYRDQDKYWMYGYGFNLDVAGFLRAQLPNLKAIGFDLISLNSYQQREIGRLAHREFLLDNNILLVEDMDLSNVKQETNIRKLVVAPLRFNLAEGSPVTIIAEI